LNLTIDRLRKSDVATVGVALDRGRCQDHDGRRSTCDGPEGFVVVHNRDRRRHPAAARGDRRPAAARRGAAQGDQVVDDRAVEAVRVVVAGERRGLAACRSRWERQIMTWTGAAGW
jgi:hypothetical protein